MIEKSEFYQHPTIYQYGYYDGYQQALAGTQWKGEEALKKEIERLKCFLEALVRERAYERMVIENKHNTAFAIQERTDEEWEQFKSENNL